MYVQNKPVYMLLRIRMRGGFRVVKKLPQSGKNVAKHLPAGGLGGFPNGEKDLENGHSETLELPISDAFSSSIIQTK